MSNHPSRAASTFVVSALYIFLLINLATITAGLMAWTARRLETPPPPAVRTMSNCAEYFFDRDGTFYWVPSRKGAGYVNFQDTDMECGD